MPADAAQRFLKWDYEPNPLVGSFRVYACRTSGGEACATEGSQACRDAGVYGFGRSSVQHPCGYRAIEMSPGAVDLEMLVSKLHLPGGRWYLVATAVSTNGREESLPSWELVYGDSLGLPPVAQVPPTTPPSTPAAPNAKPPLLAPPPSITPPPAVGSQSPTPTPPSGGASGSISQHCRWSGTCR